jgi:hypothetical protein
VLLAGKIDLEGLSEAVFKDKRGTAEVAKWRKKIFKNFL